MKNKKVIKKLKLKKEVKEKIYFILLNVMAGVGFIGLLVLIEFVERLNF